jgi:hypothetical protein
MASNLPSSSAAAPQAELIAYLKQHRIWNAEDILWQWLAAHSMPSEEIQSIHQLKTWLDAFRPLPPAVVSELRQRCLVRFTYHSNALEGNTLTQSETELVLTTGITIGGKTLQEHLEVIGHGEAIAYIELLASSPHRSGNGKFVKFTVSSFAPSTQRKPDAIDRSTCKPQERDIAIRLTTWCPN